MYIACEAPSQPFRCVLQGAHDHHMLYESCAPWAYKMVYWEESARQRGRAWILSPPGLHLTTC
jgi:hypothetical protein